MNPLSVALGYIFAVCLCSGNNQQDAATLNGLSQELILNFFSFMPVSSVARTSSVSRRFSVLTYAYLRPLFRTRQEDGQYTLDPCKIYQYYHEVEPCLPVKLLTLQVLNAARPTSLSCESFKLNGIIDIFVQKLFYEGKTRIDLRMSKIGFYHDLMAQMLKYQDSSRFYVNQPTEMLIDVVGEEKLKSFVESHAPLKMLFLMNKAYIKGCLSYRKKLYKLHQSKLSKFLQALVESGDVFDNSLHPLEISTLELIALTDYSTDEMSRKRALDLADGFIKIAEPSQLANAIECIGSTQFVIGILRKLDFSLELQKRLALIIYLRNDAETIFGALNDVESIKCDDGAIDIFLKLLHGIINNGIDESNLLPLCGGLDNESQLILGTIAAFHGRSQVLLLALASNLSKMPNDRFYPQDLLTTDSFDYAKLDLSPEENISLLKVGFFPYWNFVTVTKRVEFLEHLLDMRSVENVELGLKILPNEVLNVFTDQLYRMYIKFSIINGVDSINGACSKGHLLENEIEKEVAHILQTGVDCSKMFSDTFGSYFAESPRSVVFQTVLSWENGFDLVLKYLRPCIESSDEESVIVLLFKICIVSDIGFDVPMHLVHLIFVALDELVDELELDIDSITKTCKLDPIPSSFHRVFAEILALPEYAALVSRYYY